MRFVDRGWWLVPVLLALIINGGILFNGFVWDAVHITLPEEVRTLGQEAPKIYYRPLVGMTFRLDRLFWGGEAWGFHFTNLLLHSLNTLLVTLIGWRIFESSRLREAAALLSGSLFAVFPLHAEVVAWISGRNDLIPTMGLLIAVLAHLKLRSGSSVFWTLPFFIAGCLIGLFGKESALPFLLVFPLYDLLVWRTEGPVWRKILTPSSCAVIATAGIYIYFRTRMLGTPVGDINSEDFSLLEKAGVGFGAAGFYLKKLVWPFPLNPFIVNPSGQTSFSGVYSAAGALGVVGLVFLSIWRRYPLITIGLWSVFLGFASALAVPLIPNIAVPFAERYLYLPSVGGTYFMAAGFLAVYATFQRRTNQRAVSGSVTFVMILCIGVLAGITLDQNRVWRTEQSLWEEAVKQSPHAALPRNRLGVLYLDQGRLDEAAVHFNAALSGWGQKKVLATAATGLGVVYHSKGRYLESENAFQQAFSFHDGDGIPHFYMGKMYWDWYQNSRSRLSVEESGVLLEKTRGEMVKAVIRTPGLVEAYYILGFVNLDLGRPDKARQSFGRVVELAPDSSFAQDASRRLQAVP